MRAIQKPTVREPLLNNRLGLFDGKSGNMDVIDQRKVNVSIVAHTSFGRELRNVIDAEFQQIAGSQPQ